MAYIHLYKGVVTAGATDGTRVSEGNGATPLVVGPLNLTINEESTPIKLALRCDTGYITTGNSVLTPTGDSADKWTLALDAAGSPGVFGEYGSPLTISSAIGATNTIIWAKAKAASDEVVQDDTSVKLNLICTVIAG